MLVVTVEPESRAPEATLTEGLRRGGRIRHGARRTSRARESIRRMVLLTKGRRYFRI